MHGVFGTFTPVRMSTKVEIVLTYAVPFSDRRRYDLSSLPTFEPSICIATTFDVSSFHKMI